MQISKMLCSLFIASSILASLNADIAHSSDQNTHGPKATISTKGRSRSEYPGLAKISCVEAIRIALGKIPGNVIECKLENEDGFLVFGIEIVEKDTARLMEVQVDAGSGAVLASEEEEPENSLDELCKELGCD